MITSKNKSNSNLSITFYLFLFILLFLIGYSIYGQLELPSEATYDCSSYTNLSDGWLLTYPDGSTDTISLPSEKDTLEKGKTVSISNTIPQNEMYDTIRFWNYGQDINIYVDGDIRYQYNDKDVHAFGIDRPYLNLYYKISPEDLGKTLTLEITPLAISSAGKIGPVFIGSETALIQEAIHSTFFELFSGAFLAIIGLLVIVIGLIFIFKLKIFVPIIHLGVGVVICSLWLICNSTGRQYLSPNVSTIRNCSFLLVALMPIPFLFYFDDLQQKRHTVLFQSLEGLGILNFVVSFVLHITKIRGLSENFIFSIVMVLLFSTLIIFSVIQDLLILKVENFYNLSAIGIILFGVFGILQIVTYILLLSEQYNGIFIGIGLLTLVIMASLESIRKYNSLYYNHKYAVKQVALLSQESMKTIAKTVDAKDPYTLEHSTRVSEYSGLLARKLGWNEADIDELEKAALLHDIGKIGISDTVLNKPSKLTEEEYKTIKSHTTIGAEILQNISTLKYSHDVALYHHEKYDGTGYPIGLSGKMIPECARIVCIADSFDAMNSRRIYRDNLTKEAILSELKTNRGTQFDPEILDVFLELIEKNL